MLPLPEQYVGIINKIIMVYDTKHKKYENEYYYGNQRS